MASADVIQSKLADLPEPIQDYLYSERAGELNDKIITRNKLTEDQEERLYLLLRELYVKEVPLTRLVDEIRARFNLDGLKAKQLAVDIAGFRLLPLDKWLGDVDGYVRSLGGDTAKYPEFRVQIEHRTAETAAQEVVEGAIGAVADQRVQSRLRGVVESFLAGVRTEDQIKEVLTRPEKIGGLGFDQPTAARVLEEAREETRSVIIDHEAPPAQPTAAGAAAEYARKAASSDPDEVEPAAQTAVAKSKEDFSTIKPEDEDEIEKFKQVVLPAKGTEQADETARRIEASIDEIYQASGLKTDDEAMAKRIKTVIANRLRDVRDQMETLEVMVQPKELGGLGLSQDAARAVLNAIQAKLKSVHDEHAVQAMTEKTVWVEKEKRQKVESEQQARQGEQSDLETLYSSIVSKSKKAMRNSPPAPVSAGAVTQSAPAPVVPPNLPIATTNPIPPELRAPAVVPLPEPPAPAPRPVAPPLTVVRPTPGVAVAPQIRGTADAPKPRMDDVKPVTRLTGPVEELRAITIVDLRRLSKDPVEASAKIKDKIDVLAEQSYTRRNEAIAAWGASEVVRTYLELMGEGLNGTPLKDAVAARQAAKKPYLTPEEFQAVAALSRQLRY